MEKRLLTGVMDGDTDPRYIENGNYRRAVNLLNAKGEEGSFGNGENTPGLESVSYSLPSGNNTVVGSYFHKLTNCVYYFVYNSLDNHSIVEYDVNDDVCTLIVQSSYLNFSLTNLVLHINVIDGLLYWTDGNEEPSYINIENAKNAVYTNGSRQYFDAIQWQPRFAPTLEYGSDGSKNYNNIYGKLFQFRYNYVYDDNQISACSPISKLGLPVGESIYLSLYAQSTVNNLINVSINTGIDRVKKIQLFVREGNTSDWYLAKEFSKQELSWADNTTQVYNFYNDQVMTVADQSFVNRLFDFIPLKSDAQELIDGNRIAYGGITEGYDNIEVDMECEAVYNEPSATPDTLFQYLLAGLPFPATGVNSLDILPTSSVSPFLRTIIVDANNVTDYDTVTFVINMTTTGVNLRDTFTKTFAVGSTSEDIANWIAGEINASLQLNRTLSNTTIVTATATTSLYSGNKWKVDIALTSELFGTPKNIGSSSSFLISNTNTVKTLKRNSKHAFGIVYQDDAGRTSLVQTSDACEVVSLPFSDTPGNEGSVSTRMTINHTPPSWADRYSIVYSGSLSVSRYIWARVSNVNISGTEYSIYLTDTGLNQGFAQYNNYYNGKASLNYEWAKGDRIWFIADSSNTFYSDMVDIVINKDGTFSGGYYISVDTSIPITPTVGTLVQLYTPASNVSEKLYYEIGESYPIVNGYHTGSTQNQTASQPAIIDMNVGDAYFRYRGSLYDVYCEDSSFSDFYTSNYWDKGRPNLVDKNYKQIKRGTTIFYSEPYIPETNINGLSTIYDTSFESYPIAFGDIKRLYSDGATLEIYQRQRTGQVLVNKDVLYNANGTPNGVVGQSNSVLGQINYFSWKGGIGDNPESFCVYGDRRYHADAENGAFMRLGNDGYTPISEYRQHNYFSDKFKDLVNNVAKKQFYVLSMYDFRHDQLLVCFKEVSRFKKRDLAFEILVPAETIAFSEDKKGWTTFYDIYPESLVMTQGFAVMFKSGALYRQNSATKNKFFGTQYETSVSVVFNQDPSNSKFFKGVSVEATGIFDCPVISTPSGQSSELIESDFELWENVYYAALLRDVNTPNISNPLIEGDVLRDSTIEITFRNDNTDYVKINAVNIHHENSELTNR